MFGLHRQESLFPQFGFSGRCLFVAGSMLMAFATHASTGMVKPTYPQQVVITTGIVSLNPDGPFNTILVITRSGDRYRFVGMAYDRIKARTFSGTANAEKVAKLVAAMQAPLQPTFTFASLGAQSAPVLREVEARIHRSLAATNLSKGQKALLESVSRDPAAIEAAITASLPITHSDDYPSISVDVVMSDNSELSAQGGSQHLFMLPPD